MVVGQQRSRQLEPKECLVISLFFLAFENVCQAWLTEWKLSTNFPLLLVHPFVFLRYHLWECLVILMYRLTSVFIYQVDLESGSALVMTTLSVDQGPPLGSTNFPVPSRDYSLRVLKVRVISLLILPEMGEKEMQIWVFLMTFQGKEQLSNHPGKGIFKKRKPLKLDIFRSLWLRQQRMWP